MRIAAGVEYDGTCFRGWQYQVGQRTVQQCLEEAIGRVANHPVSVVTAGRTDTGVHASCQVFHFDTESHRTVLQWLRGINTNLPLDVGLLWVQPVPERFHARFSAVRRSYRYIILNRRQPPAIHHNKVGWDYRALDVEGMRTAGKCLIGEHDFTSFRAAGCQASSPIRRIIALQVGSFENWIWFDIVANAFLQHMVRNIVGTLTAVGAGEKPVSWVAQVLAARNRSLAGVTAPSAGLYLVSICYPDIYALPACSAMVRYW